MTKTLRYLLVTTLAVGLVASIGWAKGKPVKGGGGGNPSHVPVIADFALGGHIENDIHGVYPSPTIEGASVQLPGTGNFTIQVDGDRTLTMDVSDNLDSGPDPSVDLAAATAYSEFIAAYSGGLSRSGMSINRHCLVAHLNPDSSCADSAATEGSLRDLPYDKDDLLLTLGARIPIDNKSNYRFHCGPYRSSGPESLTGDVDTDMIIAHCTDPLSDGTTCAEWDLQPFDRPGKPGGVGGDTSAMRCTLVKEQHQGRSSDTTILGDFDLGFSLTIKRDTDGDGEPDLTDPAPLDPQVK